MDAINSGDVHGMIVLASGEHTGEVIAEMCLSAEERRELVRDGALGMPLAKL